MLNPKSAICELLQESLIQFIIQYNCSGFHTNNQIILLCICMRQFQGQIYKSIPPFGTSFFHKEIKPKQQSFHEMTRFTFFPFFTTYTFCFFWLILISFVFFYSQSYRTPLNYTEPDVTEQFLKVSQAALFQLGENIPYHIVYNFHYYRVLTSMVLFRNFHHYFLTGLEILTLGSYIQNAIGFKRCFVLSVASGIVGILCNNIFNTNATLESMTPISGIIGYSFGYYIVRSKKQWKYHENEKIQMILLLFLFLGLNSQLIWTYTNMNFLSNLVSMIYGFIYCFADPDEGQNLTLKNIILYLLMAGGLSIIIIMFFFHTKPTMLSA